MVSKGLRGHILMCHRKRTYWGRGSKRGVYRCCGVSKLPCARPPPFQAKGNGGGGRCKSKQPHSLFKADATAFCSLSPRPPSRACRTKRNPSQPPKAWGMTTDHPKTRRMGHMSRKCTSPGLPCPLGRSSRGVPPWLSPRIDAGVTCALVGLPLFCSRRLAPSSLPCHGLTPLFPRVSLPRYSFIPQRRGVWGLGRHMAPFPGP